MTRAEPVSGRNHIRQSGKLCRRRAPAPQKQSRGFSGNTGCASAGKALPATLLPPAVRRASDFPIEFRKSFGETRILLNFGPLLFAALRQGGLIHYSHKITDETLIVDYNFEAFDLALMVP